MAPAAGTAGRRGRARTGGPPGSRPSGAAAPAPQDGALGEAGGNGRRSAQDQAATALPEARLLPDSLKSVRTQERKVFKKKNNPLTERSESSL